MAAIVADMESVHILRVDLGELPKAIARENLLQRPVSDITDFVPKILAGKDVSKRVNCASVVDTRTWSGMSFNSTSYR